MLCYQLHTAYTTKLAYPPKERENTRKMLNAPPPMVPTFLIEEEDERGAITIKE
jgi:hypothetical protein